MVRVEPIKGISYYMDDRLQRDLDSTVKKALSKSKDEDYVLVIDGKERTGKSTLAFQIGAYVDHSFNINRICFTADEFRHAIINAKPHECIVFDEAYRGLGSTSALSEVNKILKGMMMEMGQKNLFVIVVIPTFYLLEKYVALWRARTLIHVFRLRKKKGYWRLYNSNMKQRLYLNPIGKRNYSYIHVRTGYKGKFFPGYIVDDDEYRKKKDSSFKKRYTRTRDEKYMEQRNKLIYILNKRVNISQEEIGMLCKEQNVGLKRAGISDILLKFKDTGR